MTDPFAPPTGESLPAPAAPAQYGTALYGEPLRPFGPVRNGLGTVGLVLGVLALLGSVGVLPGLLLGPAAVVLGLLGRARARRGEATNGTAAVAAAVTGGVGLLVSVGLVAYFFTSTAGREYVDCLRAADGTAAQQACADRLNEGLFAR